MTYAMDLIHNYELNKTALQSTKPHTSECSSIISHKLNRMERVVGYLQAVHKNQQCSHPIVAYQSGLAYVRDNYTLQMCTATPARQINVKRIKKYYISLHIIHE